ncbi:hypothetical protein [Pseudoalteromonas 'SMAR']|uniref:hypothetical protein n=1 Tax=Pseudoalteromonas 'SMAR' TaxID=3416908 RepID=UPI003AF267C5
MLTSFRGKFTAGLLAALCSLPGVAQMPKSQIWLAELEPAFHARPITDDGAYHNQPVVVDNGVYYTKEVIAGDTQQTDLFFYNFDEHATSNLTMSPESEYSPTLHPNGEGLSTIVVESSGAQRLWFYPFDSNQPRQRVFEHIKPVGYHAWGANQDLILFILGANEHLPHTLQYTDVRGHRPEIIDEDIGRTLTFNAARGVFGFSYLVNNQMWFATYQPSNDHIERFFALPKQVQDYAWLDKNRIAYALDNRIYYRDLSAPKKVHLMSNLSSYCETTISRLSFHQQKLAFVCATKAG